MKILLLADANSPHTIKWACSMAENNIEVGIFSLSNCKHYLYKKYNNITVYEKNFSCGLDSNWEKIKYLISFFDLKSIIKVFKPNILHAHYASSYGLLGALSGFKPFIISVWGSDVFDFPRKSFLHKFILKYNFENANEILSTSCVMAKEANLYIINDRKIMLTPFGIDLNVFKPNSERFLIEGIQKTDIVIGTVKNLEEHYGIKYLVKAFAILVEKYPCLPLKLVLVGGGSQEQFLKDLSKKLNIFDRNLFIGKVDYNDVPLYQNLLSIYVAVSNNESFGVSVIEASACEKPVVVSNVGGLPEVVEDGVTGIIVEPRNPEQTANAIEKLLLDENLRIMMGKAGRELVQKKFNWDDNVKRMIDIYTGILRKY